MRLGGFCLSVFAAAQIVVATAPLPAFAAAQSDATPAADAKPQKPKKATKTRTAKPKKPKKVEKKPDPSADAAPPPADAAPASMTTTTAALVPAQDMAPPPPAEPKAPEPPKPAPAPVAEAPAAPADGMIPIHIITERPVRLEKRAGSGWELVCTSPCDTAVGVSPEYRIAGDGINPSEPFTLEGSHGYAKLKVDPGTPGGQTRGVWTMIGSGAVLAGGVAVIALGTNRHFDAQGNVPQGSINALLAGSVMIAGAVVGGFVGGAWYVSNAHTQVTGNVGHATGEKTPPKSVQAARAPTWNAPQIGAPAATSVPFLSGTF
jgi:hypothetical protein